MDMNVQKTSKQAFNSAAKSADTIASDIKASANHAVDLASDRFEDAQDSLMSRYKALKDSASESYDTAVDTVKKYPLYAVLGATGIGLLAGLLLGRRKN